MTLAIRALVERAAWAGTAADLHDALNRHAKEDARRGTDWPKNARSMKVAIQRLVPNLREAGIEVSFGGPTGPERRKLIALTPRGMTPVVPQAAIFELPAITQNPNYCRGLIAENAKTANGGTQTNGWHPPVIGREPGCDDEDVL